jgi:16S rRNA (guanine1516-N2)-methyltransferase
MIERSPFLAALLNDGLIRYNSTNPLLLKGEAKRLIAKADNHVDTIYLDPMYPHRNKSALNKQEMRIIRELVGDDDDADEVFLTAIQFAAKRVVVKRPKGAPLLCRKTPSHVIKMKNSRFDVYMI